MRGFRSFLKGWNAIAVWGMQHIATWRVGFAFTGPCCFGLKFRKLDGVQSRAWCFFWPPCPPPSHTTVVCTYITLPRRSNFLCSFVPPKQQERIRKETSTGSLCGASVAGTTNQHLAHKGSAGRSAAASNCLSSWTMNDDVQSWRTGVAILYYLGGKFQQGSFGSVEFLLMAECCKWISVPCWEGQASARRISIDMHKLHFKSRHNLDI